MADCDDYHNISPRSKQCEFISKTESCADNDGLVHYLRFPYCDLPGAIPLADIILFIWIAYLFVCLAVTAEDYFCPALTSISKMLKLSQNVAGVTFLALGNGSPDIFSCIAALGSGNLETSFLALGAMFGAGLFVNTVVIGAVTVSQDGYALARRPFFRDCIFYLAAIYWTWYNCYNKKLNLATGIGYIALYAVYVLLVIVGRLVFQRFIKKQSLTTNVNPDPNIDTNYAADTGNGNFLDEDQENIPIIESDTDENTENGNEGVPGIGDDDGDWTEIPGVRSAAFTRALAVAQTLPYLAQSQPSGRSGLVIGPDTAETPLLRHDLSYSSPLQRSTSAYEYPSYSMGAAKQMVKNFILAMNPLHLEDWDTEYSLKDRIFDVVSAPGNVLFKITIPVVDLDSPLLGWSKLLNSLQLLMCPVIGCLLLRQTDNLVISVPVPVIAGCCGLMFMIVMLLTSSQGECPFYFKTVYTLLGFLMSILWIYTIANEIVSLLSTFGHMFKINGAILGLTVLSWANSVGDLVSDVAMAKQGYPQMAVSACIGGPCLNMLLGIGLASTIAIIKHGRSLELKLSGTLIISSAFLMFTICSHLVAVPLMNFKVKKWYGFYMFGLYGCFLVIALLNVTNVFAINSDG
jgi:sodium/potassium/calcium exchanger 6